MVNVLNPSALAKVVGRRDVDGGLGQVVQLAGVEGELGAELLAVGSYR